jgi:hypothetical protein
LTPAVNDLMGLEYGYVPRTGRWVLLIFGNVRYTRTESCGHCSSWLFLAETVGGDMCGDAALINTGRPADQLSLATATQTPHDRLVPPRHLTPTAHTSTLLLLRQP